MQSYSLRDARSRDATFRGRLHKPHTSARKQRFHPGLDDVENLRLAAAPATPASRGGSDVAGFLSRHGLGAATRVGKGSFGVVYSVGAADARRVLGTLDGTTPGSPLPTSGRVALKLGEADKPWREFVAESAHEAQVHAYLQTRGCAREFVPEFYGAGFDTATGLSVTAMEVVDGRPLYLVDDIDARLFAAIERAVVTLWLQGVAHADLHKGNMMVTRDRRPVVIDFGYSVVMDPERARDVQARLQTALVSGNRTLADRLWYGKAPAARASVQQYVNHVMALRKPPRPGSYYGADGMLLKRLYNALGAAERKAVPAARASEWRLAGACSASVPSSVASSPGVRTPSPPPPGQPGRRQDSSGPRTMRFTPDSLDSGNSFMKFMGLPGAASPSVSSGRLEKVAQRRRAAGSSSSGRSGSNRRSGSRSGSSSARPGRRAGKMLYRVG